MKGRITAVIRARGFGFLLDEENRSRFFHANEVRGALFDDLREGLHVEFDPVEIPERGLRAVQVRVLNP